MLYGWKTKILYIYNLHYTVYLTDTFISDYKMSFILIIYLLQSVLMLICELSIFIYVCVCIVNI